MAFDLSQSDLISIAHQAENFYGHIDILINNAGIGVRGSAVETSLAVDHSLMNVNYFGPVALTKAVLPTMFRRKCGHIVVISSVQGLLSLPYRSAYCASKHAVQGFFNSLRSEVHDSGIKVTTVCPGYVRTSFSQAALTGDGSRHGKMDASTEQGMSPGALSSVVLSGIVKGQEQIVCCEAIASVGYYLSFLAPGVMSWQMKSRARKMKILNEVEATTSLKAKTQ